MCILTPVFKDYEKYLKEFEEAKQKQKNDEKSNHTSKDTGSSQTSATFSFGKPSAPAVSPTLPAPTSTSNSVFSSFSFGGADSQKLAASPPKPENKIIGISFGISANSEKPAQTSFGSSGNKGISFGNSSSDGKGISFGNSASDGKGITFGSTSSASSLPAASAAAPTFSFGLNNSTPLFGGLSGSTSSFSFGNTVPPPSSDTKPEEEADEEPPKNEFVPVVEDDSLYSKRCKVFVKGAADYVDRGVGTLYIKKVEESKIQMIVRADTNLGNIIFNIMIVEGLPVSRLGKNNVMVVCIPTPDAKPPPVSCLLRVKTGEEADELLETIKKHMK